MVFKEPIATEQQARAAGHTQLTGAELAARISGAAIIGLYRRGFHFRATLAPDGSVAGQNHVGVHDSGRWRIDEQAHTLSVTWSGGWEANTTHAFQVGDEIQFFDVDSGRWRTTFRLASSSLADSTPAAPNMPLAVASVVAG